MSDRKGIRRRRRLGLIVGTKDNAFFIILINRREAKFKFQNR